MIRKKLMAKVAMIIGVFLLLFSAIAPSVEAYTVTKDIVTQDDVSVEIKQIKELNNAFSNVFVDDPSDVFPQTLATLLLKDSVGDYGNFSVMGSSRDVKRYVYPGATDAQLRGATITPEQAVAWLHHVGYTATLINRPLTTSEIKERLDASTPIVPIFSSSNANEWLGGNYAGILYAHDDVAVAGDTKLNKSFIEAIGHGDAMIQDGQENQPFSFGNSTSDEQNAQSSEQYQWTQTITDIKQDPSMTNAQTIDSNRTSGIFQSKKTTSGQYSSVEFTEPSVIKATQSYDAPTISYSTYMQNKGWMPAVTTGYAGVPGGTLRMESFKTNLTHLPVGVTGGISYSTYVQSKGWQPVVSNGAVSGTTGLSLRIEAIKINLTGALAQQYSVYYQGYVEGTGYTKWFKDGESLGTAASGKMLKGILIQLRKNAPSPSQETKDSAVKLINLYEDGEHQKTVSDLETFAKVSSNAAISSQQIMDWYHFLGFEFDTNQGRFSKDKAMAINDTGRLYFTLLKASKETTALKNYGLIGVGYMNNSAGYQPSLYTFSNQDTVPYARYIPTAKENVDMTPFFDRIKNYNYDKFSTIDLDGNPVDDFQEEVTLYNIRAKEINDKVVFPSTGGETAPSVTSVQSNADFKTVSNFTVRETQGQEPWCSEYDAASIINTLNKVPSETTNGTITAKELMSSYFPGKTEEELKAMSGGNIADSLAVLKNKYQVTADVLDRKLSFEEVKQQIDNGQPIQMDLYEQGNEAPKGSENNLGHAVTIVGYVVPKDGDISTHAPYYEVWNPWWGKTFYISSNAPTINLGGTDYEWSRTWYNWRKTTSTEEVQVDPSLGEQKMASAVNPSALNPLSGQSRPAPSLLDHKIISQLGIATANPVDHLFSPIQKNKSEVRGNLLSENGKVVSFNDYLKGIKLSYSEIDGGTKVLATLNGAKKRSNANSYTTEYIKDIDNMKQKVYDMLTHITMAVLMAAAAVFLSPFAQKLIETILLVALGGSGGYNFFEFASDYQDYKDLLSESTSAFTQMKNDW